MGSLADRLMDLAGLNHNDCYFGFALTPVEAEMMYRELNGLINRYTGGGTMGSLADRLMDLAGLNHNDCYFGFALTPVEAEMMYRELNGLINRYTGEVELDALVKLRDRVLEFTHNHPARYGS